MSDIDYDLDDEFADDELSDDEFVQSSKTSAITNDGKDLDSLIVDDIGNSLDPEEILKVATTAIAIQKNIPYIPELLGNHSRRMQFLENELRKSPPATPSQQELIANLYSRGEPLGDALNSMASASKYIESKLELYNPRDRIVAKARRIAEQKGLHIESHILINDDLVRQWVEDNE